MYIGRIINNCSSNCTYVYRAHHKQTTGAIHTNREHRGQYWNMNPNKMFLLLCVYSQIWKDNLNKPMKYCMLGRVVLVVAQYNNRPQNPSRYHIMITIPATEMPRYRFMYHHNDMPRYKFMYQHNGRSTNRSYVIDNHPNIINAKQEIINIMLEHLSRKCCCLIWIF